jgi:hypothetical protein
VLAVVSTHFDDAVFSCWTVIESDEDVEVITVFSAGPLDQRVTDWDADTGVDSATRMVQRVVENDAALSLAGRRAINLPLRERQYDGGAVDHDLLRPRLGEAARVYVPSGTARNEGWVNAEHGVVRDACLAIRPDAYLYADNPYWQFRDDPELPLGWGIGLRRCVVELTSEQRERKAEAIRCYAGELTKLERIFGPCADPDHLEYEVFWAPQ